MDTSNWVIQLCQAGTRTEFERQNQQVWEARTHDYEACGDQVESRRYDALAAELGIIHQPSGYSLLRPNYRR